MASVKALTMPLCAVFLIVGIGCASTRTYEGAGESVADGLITTQVKTAISNGPGLKGSGIKVRTFKGVERVI